MINISSYFFKTVLKNLNIEIVEVGHLYADQEWNFSIHGFPNNRLYFVLDGEGEIERDNHKVYLKKGNMYLIPLNSPYKLSCKAKMEKIYIHFNAEIIPGHDIFQDSKECIYKEFPQALCSELIEKFNSDNISDALICKSIIMSTIGEFIQISRENNREWFDILIKYEKIYSYIKNNCNANITIKELAEVMKLSPSTLSKKFKGDMGYSLKKYINSKLIEKVKEYLLFSDLSIKEIGEKLGFCDEFYLSNFFKKYVGVSPKEYRNINC